MELCRKMAGYPSTDDLGDLLPVAAIRARTNMVGADPTESVVRLYNYIHCIVKG